MSKKDADAVDLIDPSAAIQTSSKFLEKSQYDALPETDDGFVTENYLNYEKEGKYPRSAFFLTEAILDLCLKIYLADIADDNAPFTLFYTGLNWDPFTIVFAPCELDDDYQIIEDSFDSTMHEAMQEFIDDIGSVCDGMNVKTDFADGIFSIEAKSPKDLLKLIENFVEECQIPVKDFAVIEPDENEDEDELCFKDSQSSLKSKFQKHSKEGLEAYAEYGAVKWEQGDVLLRHTANRPYSNLDHAAAITNVGRHCPMKSSLGELRNIVAEETKSGFEKIRGFNRTN